MAVSIGRQFPLGFGIPQTELLAATGIEHVAPFEGRIEGLNTIVQTAVTTGGTLKVQINGVDVAGLVVTVPNGATKGSVRSVAPTLPSITRSFKKGDRITFVPASFASAGALSGNLVISASPGERA